MFSVDKGMLVLRKSVDLGVNIKTVAEKIYSFGIGGRFLFASVMAESGNVMQSASEVCVTVHPSVSVYIRECDPLTVCMFFRKFYAQYMCR